MSGFRVNIPIGIDWIIPIIVEESSWVSRRRKIIITIVALVSIITKTIANLALRSAISRLMW